MVRAEGSRHGQDSGQTARATESRHYKEEDSRIRRAGRVHYGSLEGCGVELSRGGGRPRVVDAKTRHRRDKQRVRHELHLEREEQSSGSCERVARHPSVRKPAASARRLRISCSDHDQRRAQVKRPQCMTAMATGQDHGPRPGRPYDLSVETLAHAD
ncbi:hypothetical protein OH76DRAFT_559703 [Lentinus brumalis]|uniref:Uncharacterized protein n=1 Tax=Lentinus brumalis TaxID=2498619 RepID=A0A371D9F3_9APHY|nr:hypothetical protein OH76DRAFT_559703 [Polyporus brumalis]